MRKIAIVLIAVLAIGCGEDEEDIIIDVDNDGIPDDIDDDIGQPPPTTLEWRANIVGTAAIYPLTATGVVTQLVGSQSFTASIAVRGDTPGAVRPWHVHFGRCGAGGAIVGADAAYPRLRIASDGVAAAEVVINVGLDPAASYAMNIHKSDADFNTIIACGDMLLQ